MKGCVAVIWLLFQLPWTATAQQLSDTLRIGEVVVTAGKPAMFTGLKISRPDSAALSSGMAASLSELLAAHTPVYIRDHGQGSEATASFRGTAASHALVVWNGIRVNSPMTGYTDLSLLPLFFVDGVYLLHGGSSLAESSGALGGSIHLENKPVWNHGGLFSGILERGSFHSGKTMLRADWGGRRIHGVTRLYNETSRNDFPFLNVGVIPHRRDTLRNGGYGRSALLQELYWRPAGNLLAAIRFWYQNSRRDLPQLMSYEGSERREERKDRQTRVQTEASHYRPGLAIHFSGALGSNVMEYRRMTTMPEYTLENSSNRELSWCNLLRVESDVSDAVQLRASLEFNHYRVGAVDLVRTADRRNFRNEGSLMLHLLLRPSARLGLFALNRTETYDGTMIPLVPAAGFEWRVSPRRPLDLKANVTRNYHKPSLNDLYWVPGGNPELLPETGLSGEMTLSASTVRKNFSLTRELSLYGSRIDNWIIWQPSPSGAWYWEAQNLKKVDSAGGELEMRGTLQIKQWNFRLSGNYACTRTTNRKALGPSDRSVGRQLIYIPEHTANIHFGATRGGWDLRGSLRYTGRRYTESSNEESFFECVLNPFWLSSLAIQKKIPVTFADVRLKWRVENLLDANYQQVLWRPMPGRHYFATLAASFGT